MPEYERKRRDKRARLFFCAVLSDETGIMVAFFALICQLPMLFYKRMIIQDMQNAACLEWYKEEKRNGGTRKRRHAAKKYQTDRTD